MVDDERETADLYEHLLIDEYEVRTTDSGEQALATIDGVVDVVLLDRRMPGVSGEEVLRRLRTLDTTHRMVMITGVQPDIGIIDLPFDDYLLKPVTEEQLHDAIARMLSRDSHDDTVQTVLALASKMATLESKIDISELQASDRYASLETRFETLWEEIRTDTEEDLYPEFRTEKLGALFS